MKYRCILADCPWKFRNAGTRLNPSYAGKQRKKAVYKPMPLEDIIGMGSFVKDLAEDDSFLLLWCPNALVIDGTADVVAKAWGFKAKQLIPWLKTSKAGKPRIAGGNYSRVCTEQLVLCRRGAAQVKRRDVPGIIIAARPRLHSGKPDASYEYIERLIEGPYIELFARRQYSKDWMVMGDQLEGKYQVTLGMKAA